MSGAMVCYVIADGVGTIVGHGACVATDVAYVPAPPGGEVVIVTAAQLTAVRMRRAAWCVEAGELVPATT